MPYTLQFESSGVNPDVAIVHDNETFHVQWAAQNLGPDATLEFVDRLVVTLRPEGCAGPEQQEETIIYDSDADADPADFVESPIKSGAVGPLMAPKVGPFGVGAYRLSVILDAQGSQPVSLFNCIDIVAAT